MGIISFFSEYATSKAKSFISKIFAQSELDKELNKTLNKWKKGLPRTFDFDTIALFDPSLLKPNKSVPSDISDIADTLSDGRIPRESNWLKALVCLWSLRNSSGQKGLSIFFTLALEDAKRYLKKLAKALEETCIEIGRLFNGEVIKLLDQHSSTLEQLLEITTKVERLVAADKSIQSNALIGKEYSHLVKTLFVCQSNSKYFLGVSISNSGLIVCGGEEKEEITMVMRFGGTTPIKIIQQKWNDLRFINIKTTTSGAVPYFPMLNPSSDEIFLTFDANGSLIKGSPCHITGIPLFDSAFDLLFRYYGLINILLPDNNINLAPCPVFSSNLEFVGIGVLTSKIQNKEGSDSTLLAVYSCQKYTQLIWPVKK